MRLNYHNLSSRLLLGFLLISSLFSCLMDLLLVNAVFNPVTKPIIKFNSGGDQSCAVFDTYKMKCWGLGLGLGLGGSNIGYDSQTTGDNMPYFLPGTSLNIISVTCLKNSCCVLLTNGNIKCFGSNYAGQVGIGQISTRIGAINGYVGDSLPYVNLGPNITVTAIAGGLGHFCTLTNESKVKCVGLNDSGQLGYGDTKNRGSSPYDMDSNLTYVDLGVGVEIASVYSGPTANHNCVILSKPSINVQRIKCWGLNNYYQLGYGDSNNRGDIANTMGDNLGLVDLGIQSKVKFIAIGLFHTCTLLVTDILKCFGSGGEGQIGSGLQAAISQTGDLMPSVLIDSGKTVKLIAAGEQHTCIVYDDQVTLKCFGWNKYGQLGQGDMLSRGNTLATNVPNITAVDLGTGSLKIKSVQCGSIFTCVLFENDSIKCFGDNVYAQAGIGIPSIGRIGIFANQMGTNAHFAELFSPTQSPTNSPTRAPSSSPTAAPTYSPSLNPTTNNPSKNPTSNPTLKPTSTPIVSPTKSPVPPTKSPTNLPTSSPTQKCTYPMAKLCEYDYNCMWAKVDGVKQCVIFDCTKFNKGKCGKERKKCKWDKTIKTCNIRK